MKLSFYHPQLAPSFIINITNSILKITNEEFFNVVDTYFGNGNGKVDKQEFMVMLNRMGNKMLI